MQEQSMKFGNRMKGKANVIVKLAPWSAPVIIELAEVSSLDEQDWLRLDLL